MKKIMKKADVFLAAVVMAALFLINPITTKASVSLESLMQQYVGSTWNEYYYGSQCKGFANYIFYRLWDVKYIGPAFKGASGRLHTGATQGKILWAQHDPGQQGR